MKDIFPIMPRLAKGDHGRLVPKVSNEGACRAWLATNPGIDDLKRAYLIEIERGWQVRAGIEDRLLRRIQALERSEILARAAVVKRKAVQS